MKRPRLWNKPLKAELLTPQQIDKELTIGCTCDKWGHRCVICERHETKESGASPAKRSVEKSWR